MDDDINWRLLRKWVIIGALVLFVGLPIVSYGAYLGGSWLYQTVTSKVERQNQNADPNYQRGVALDFTNTFTDFNRSYTSAPTDYDRLIAFMRVNCQNQPWNVQTEAQYNNLSIVYTGDFEAMQRDSAHYEQLMADPDTAKLKPSGMPDRLTLPMENQLPACP